MHTIAVAQWLACSPLDQRRRSGMTGSRLGVGRTGRARFATLAMTVGIAVPTLFASGSVALAQDDNGKFCEGTNIVFFPGGTEGGGFETVVYNGARAAEAAFGPTITYM